MPVCKSCHGTEFERDLSNANNDLVCKACGVVSEDNPIVSEVTFGESSAGAAVVQGSFIGAGQSHASFGGSSALESREATLNKREENYVLSLMLCISRNILPMLLSNGISLHWLTILCKVGDLKTSSRPVFTWRAERKRLITC